MATASSAAAVEEEESVIIPEMRFASENIESLFIYLFQYGSKDVQGLRNLSGLFPSTSSQMVMSGINNHDRNINIAEWGETWAEGGALVGRESINLDTFLHESTGMDQLEKMILFKRYYSWLSSVVMPREERQGQMALVSNEDEHVLAYGFMLTFGGGLGKLPTKETASAAVSTLAVDPNALLTTITEFGVDPQFYSTILSDDTCCSLLRAIGYNDPGILKFVRNTFLLNYHGMFFSEQVANQVKSNLIFINLQINDGKPEFFPSRHRINEFCEMMEIYKQSINPAQIRRLNEKMELAKQPEPAVEQSAKATYYNKAIYANKFFLGGWQNVAQHYNIENAKATMFYILNKLCRYLNNHAIHRLFFNIVMNKIYLERYKKKEKRLRPIILARTGDITASLATASQRLASSSYGSPPRSSVVQPGSVRRAKIKRPQGASASSDAAGADAAGADAAGASEESFLDTPDNEFIKAYVDSLDGEALSRFNTHISNNEELDYLFDSVLPPKSSKPAKKRAKKIGKIKRGGKRTKRKRRKRRKTKKKRSRFKRS